MHYFLTYINQVNNNNGRLNQGLARFESLYNVPVFTSTWIVFTIVAGGVMYNEFAKFSVIQALAFPTGVFLCCLGVFYLSRSTNTSGVDAPGIGEDNVDDDNRRGMTELRQTDSSIAIGTGNQDPLSTGSYIDDEDIEQREKPITSRRGSKESPSTNMTIN